jgi:Flp pilus assembly protein TadG
MATDMTMLRHWAAADRGQSLVEVALCLPILLLIVIGIVDIGRIYAYRAATTNAAREAAVHAARDPQAARDDICQRARNELGAGYAANPCATAPIAVSCTRGGLDCGNDTSVPLYQVNGAATASVSVTVRYDVQLLTGYLVDRVFSANPVQVFGTAAFDGLGE